MALKHALLSALSRGQPLNGYKLSSIYNGKEERAWYASPSQVYAELIKMEEDQLVAVSDRNDRGHTDYVITDIGLAELRNWLQLTDPDHNVRDDSVMRLMNLWLLDEESARHLIEKEIAFQRTRRTRLERRVEMYATEMDNSPVWRNRQAVTELWLAQSTLMIAWLEGLIVVLSDPEPSVSDIYGDLRELFAAQPGRPLGG